MAQGLNGFWGVRGWGLEVPRKSLQGLCRVWSCEGLALRGQRGRLSPSLSSDPFLDPGLARPTGVVSSWKIYCSFLSRCPLVV
jgi:hypothetical protein